ncbi:MAG: hypothetical protein SWY16_00970 [Cyanobacteriota bacterium]|nr:hypothetical protein [Cyanobacteriota bacterium]
MLAIFPIAWDGILAVLGFYNPQTYSNGIRFPIALRSIDSSQEARSHPSSHRRRFQDTL